MLSTTWYKEISTKMWPACPTWTLPLGLRDTVEGRALSLWIIVPLSTMVGITDRMNGNKRLILENTIVVGWQVCSLVLETPGSEKYLCFSPPSHLAAFCLLVMPECDGILATAFIEQWGWYLWWQPYSAYQLLPSACSHKTNTPNPFTKFGDAI